MAGVATGQPKVVTPKGEKGAGKEAVAQTVNVTGCKNVTVGNIIKGSYSVTGSNHGKPVYKKDAGGSAVVLIYFWDERDGAAFSGWWFGPKVGGDQVWAYNGSGAGAAAPPVAGWQVPWDGPVDDTVKVSPAAKRPAEAAAGQGGQWGSQQQWNQPQWSQAGPAQKQARVSAAEAEMAKRQADLKKKREEEEARRGEQTAALAVRKVIQRVRIATPENFDELRAELEATQVAQLEKMGSQADKVAQEAEKALTQAQERVDAINNKKQEEELAKLEAEQNKKKEAEKIDGLVKAAVEEVAAAEKEVEKAEKAAEPITDAEKMKELTADGLVNALAKTDKAVEAAQTKLDAVSKSVSEKKTEMGNSEVGRAKLKEEFKGLYGKLASGRRALEKIKEVSKANKDKAVRKVAAAKRDKAQGELFKKFDKNKDGKLDGKEIKTFAKAEYSFELEEEQVQRILNSLAREGGGVAVDKFRRVRAMCAIAKSEIKAREKRKEEEEKLRIAKEAEEARKAALEAQKTEIKAIVTAAGEELKAAEEALAKVRESAKPLGASAKDEMPVSKLREKAAEVEEEAKAIKDKAATVEAKCVEIEGDAAKEEPPAEDGEKGTKEKEKPSEIAIFRKTQAKALRAKLGKLMTLVDAVLDQVKKAESRAAKKAYAELTALTTEAVSAIREHMAEKDVTGEDLFKKLSGGQDKKLSEPKLTAFLEELPGLKEKIEGKAKELFIHLAGGQKKGEAAPTGIQMSDFLELIRIFFKVVKPTVMTENSSIKSKTARRLEVGEVVEALEAPKKEEGVGVLRVKCRTVSEPIASGFATIAGNQGTVFLEPGGNFMQCIKETVMTDGFSVEGSKTTRKVLKGEVFEVLEFPKKDESCNVMRIKAKAKKDGQVGFITLAGNAGSTFLELC
eukprot:gnl/TRDRNA2_/TRDRNA2_69467_c0_seq1.p1 gnl/TRDRNA2_/TRDRNA2_69467_c0~~gnl/TRDRNA2_/TRDRNA2_69467_c0_seq1.p1  ORF type:complete len:938 (-),score=322.79 gnl/TRDRNA2_/TRDRNA2_69467_c0_seq1:66-2777(-)